MNGKTYILLVVAVVMVVVAVFGVGVVHAYSIPPITYIMVSMSGLRLLRCLLLLLQAPQYSIRMHQAM
jgi:hypothetical protein